MFSLKTFENRVRRSSRIDFFFFKGRRNHSMKKISINQFYFKNSHKFDEEIAFLSYCRERF